ncbi:uncharacterized protein EDC30_105113 [Paucimonas lemoignei]|uniref:Uncharacterized protein n=1 Tax=Paucimonas lemoignei TaxID=29443 RepID=A0A4R3HWD5_PAULE|nr:PP0621 family protein [Paucimonas lemoignei]TCS36893.1 uncharacterized protein EDC30_105113 [Paucimonas lemoignei]
MKLLIWMVIVILVVAWIMRSKQQASQGAGQMESRSPGHQGKPEGMLPCSHCGLYIPASEAVRHASGAVYCCDEHRRQAGPGT